MTTRTRTETDEQDTRLNILNTLLTTPHRALDTIYPVHREMVQQDPLFYVRLAAWYSDTGEIRDHKEMFIVTLCLSDFEGHRDVGLALLRLLPPYQVGRVIDFIHGRYNKVVEKQTPHDRRTKKSRSKVTTVKFGLFRNVPNSTKTEVLRYLRERESSPVWFDRCVLSARKNLKRLYKILRIAPGDRAQSILFDNNPPEDSSLAAVKDLNKAENPADQAKVIVEHKIPYRIASTVIKAMTPTVLLALVTVMSDQELINNMSSLKKRGAFDNADIKSVIKDRLDKAKTGKRVAAMKTTEAIKASDVDEDIQQQLEEVADTQVKSKGRIKRPTALLIDKSKSMSEAIEIGKRMGSMISAIMDSDLYVYAFDAMPYPLHAKRDDIASWEEAFAGIKSGGWTCCGAGIEMLRKNKQFVEQIVMVTDEGENQSPRFRQALENYGKEYGIPHVVFFKCGRYKSDRIERELQQAGHPYDAYEFDGDYYSLPQLIPFLTQVSRLDLLMDIMQYRLPKRKLVSVPESVAVAV